LEVIEILKMGGASNMMMYYVKCRTKETFKMLQKAHSEKMVKNGLERHMPVCGTGVFQIAKDMSKQ
jgi:hypothetical protein